MQTLREVRIVPILLQKSPIGKAIAPWIELELGTARPAQSQAAEPQDALEMCKQHLNPFPITARSLKCLGLGQRPSNVTSLLVDAARHPTEGRLWAALRLQRAATAVPHAGPIKKCLAIVDQPARRREDLASGAGVHVALFVEPEVVPTEGPILAPRLVDDRDVRSDLLVLNEPVEVCSRAVGGIGRQPLGLQTKALLGSLDHSLGSADLGLPDGAGGFDIHDDAKLHVDQIIVGIGKEGWPTHRARPLG